MDSFHFATRVADDNIGCPVKYLEDYKEVPERALTEFFEKY